MGKVNKENKRMTEVTAERRKNVNLKRSKSVRASLRMIGNRFLHHKERMPRSPSLQSLCQVETILKTPQPEAKTRPKQLFSQPPPVVPPKAAAVLQIPLEPIYYRANPEECNRGRHSWFLHQKNGRECDLEGRFAELLDGGGNGAFHRSSLRLSITTKRRHAAWNSSFSSTSSRWWWLEG